MDDTLLHWEEVARRGTRGDMVWDILRAWRAERDASAAAALDAATRAGALVRCADCKRLHEKNAGC
jgi:hypothetical protein